jgi:small GTP-binding protein
MKRRQEQRIPKPDYDYLFKIAILGDSSAGKSSLLLRISDNIFSQKLVNDPPDFKIRTIDVKGKACKLHIWDTHGVRWKGLLESNLKTARGAHCILIAFDLNSEESFNNAKSLIERASVPFGPPVLLVGTKSDLNSERRVTKNAIEELCNEQKIPYFETSAKENTNIDELLETAAIVSRVHIEEPCTYASTAEMLEIPERLSACKKELRELCNATNDTYPGQIKIKNNLLSELDSVQSFSELKNKLMLASKQSEAIQEHFFATNPWKTIYDDILAKLPGKRFQSGTSIKHSSTLFQSNPQIDLQKEKQAIINEIVDSIIDNFGSAKIISGQKTPASGGKIFGGLFGTIPTLDEQSDRDKLVAIAESYQATRLNDAPVHLKKLIKEINDFKGISNSENIKKGVDDVQEVVQGKKYPALLIAIFCIPVVGQLSFIFYKMWDYLLPHPENKEDFNIFRNTA